VIVGVLSTWWGRDCGDVMAVRLQVVEALGFLVLIFF